MQICKKLVCTLVVILALELTTLTKSEDVQKPTDEPESDDYFYDASLTEEEIAKQREQKAELARQRELEEAAKKPTEPEPEWFKRSNNTDDPMAKFMEEAIKEYMKRMQNEYMEKMKSKKKSDINHPFWSVITLAVFFGTGILIGLAIVVVRGNSFNKSSRLNGSSGGKKQQNGGRESINRSAYVSVPQKEQIMI